MWYPSPKIINTKSLVTFLLACHDLQTTSNPTFTSYLYLLLERLKNQDATSNSTTFTGSLTCTEFWPTILKCDILNSYLTSTLTLNSPVLISGATSMAVSITSAYPINTGDNTLVSLMEPNVSSGGSVSLSLGKDLLSNNSVQIRYLNSSASLNLQGSTNGIKVYNDVTDFTPSLRIASVELNPVFSSTTTTITTANPSNSITWTRTGVTCVQVNFIKLKKATSRSTVFLQCGQGSNFMTTAGDYGGLTVGSYDFELSPPAYTYSTTGNGISLFTDLMEIDFEISGTVTLTKMGTVSGKGELWSVKVQTYSPAYSNTEGVSRGFGYVQMSATYPSLTSIRFNCFSGNFASGTMIVNYV